ncbi:hypothetical protein, unlikely [Trypanosoma congolense IL3000]|uniref:Uncharacterized protein n=1 Tax=Trypanosoma congolense (strain IL3000) TaxID=1068625 RepID=F9WIU5_TRYCI|nr:hypothetical protein, unlikely [Trypanosoma congolense IL3000]
MSCLSLDALERFGLSSVSLCINPFLFFLAGVRGTAIAFNSRGYCRFAFVQEVNPNNDRRFSLNRWLSHKKYVRNLLEPPVYFFSLYECLAYFNLRFFPCMFLSVDASRYTAIMLNSSSCGISAQTNKHCVVTGRDIRWRGGE